MFFLLLLLGFSRVEKNPVACNDVANLATCTFTIYVLNLWLQLAQQNLN